MTITPTAKLLILGLVIIILLVGFFLKIQNQKSNLIDESSIIPPSINTVETVQPTIVKDQDAKDVPSCKDIPKSDNPLAGMTYLDSYCMGNYCQPESAKEACEAVDVVTISNRKLNSSWGQDNVGDCFWIETAPELVRCQVKYN